MPDLEPDNSLVPSTVGGAPVELRVTVYDAAGEVTQHRLSAGRVLSLGREAAVPDELADQIADGSGPLAPFPVLQDIRRSQLERIQLGLSRGYVDPGTSDSALTVFFAPHHGWTAVHTASAADPHQTQRWAHLPQDLEKGQSIVLPDRLAIRMLSGFEREHVVVLEQDGAALSEERSRRESEDSPGMTVRSHHSDDAVVLRWDDETLDLLVRIYEQFLRFDPPLPAPTVAKVRDKRRLAALGMHTRDDASRLRDRILAAARTGRFSPNGGGGSPTDNVHYLYRAISDGVLTFTDAQRRLASLDEASGSWLRQPRRWPDEEVS